MSGTPWVRWFTSDWVANTAHLGPLEEGCYSKLVHHYYLSGRPLPEEMDRICMISRATEPSSRRATECIIKEYFYLSEDPEYGKCYRHTRIDAELAYSEAAHSTAVSRAKKGASARWNKRDSDASSIAQAMHKQCSSNAEPEPEPEPELKPKKETSKSKHFSAKEKNSRVRKVPNYSEKFTEFWFAYPKQRRKEKPKAWAAWQAVNGEVGAAAIMMQLELQKKHDNQFLTGHMPFPERYLKNRKFEDEIDDTPIRTQQNQIPAQEARRRAEAAKGNGEVVATVEPGDAVERKHGGLRRMFT